MLRPMNAAELLDRHYLEVRARLLEIAAVLDRIDRGEGSVEDDPRMEQLREGIETLLAAPGSDAAPSGSRAERIQHLFSLPYHSDWRSTMGV